MNHIELKNLVTICKSNRINPSEVLSILVLADCDSWVEMRKIIPIMCDIRATYAGQKVKWWEIKGWVARTRGLDERVVWLKITPEGRKFADNIRRALGVTTKITL